jgi:hypothetical protein
MSLPSRVSKPEVGVHSYAPYYKSAMLGGFKANSSLPAVAATRERRLHS